jgi:predicted phosphoribosyltransferase
MDGLYRDRTHAGEVLAAELVKLQPKDPVVLGIPNGGVKVAVPIARTLKADFDLIVVRKIPIPQNTEAGFGAVTSDGDVVLNEPLVERIGLKREEIDRLAAAVRGEIRERVRFYKGEGGLVPIEGRTLILVDDGLASGYTMIAALKSLIRKRPAKTIVAVPTAPRTSVERVAELADRVICPNLRETFFFAVADAYRNWYDLDRFEVRALLEEAGPARGTGHTRGAEKPGEA